MIAYYIENGENNEIFNIGYTDIISNGGNSYNITFEFEGVEISGLDSQISDLLQTYQTV